MAFPLTGFAETRQGPRTEQSKEDVIHLFQLMFEKADCLFQTIFK